MAITMLLKAASLSGLRRSRGRQGDHGASAIELAIVAPVLLILIWLIVQYALYFQARQVALAAAQEGDRWARQNASTTIGWQAVAAAHAEDYYKSLGTRVLGNSVGATAKFSGPGQVQVTVSGTMISILFGFSLPPVTETVTGPEECFRPDVGGGQQC
jgi:Flp pilus assembly protein TadG